MTTARALLAVALVVSSQAGAAPPPSGGAAAARPTRPHDADLKRLDGLLGGGDLAAAQALLQALQPQLDADDRFALDTIYVLLGHRRLPEARDQWNRVGARLQERFGRPSESGAAAEARRQRWVAEALFVQGLLTARLGQKEDALQLLRQADGYGFPPLDSPLVMLAADTLFELQEYALAAQAYQESLKQAPANVKARLGLAASLYSSGRLAAAEGELRQVLQKAPGTAHAEYLLGAVLFEQKRTDEAKTHLERELARDAGCASCLAKLAHIAYLAGDDQQCEALVAKAAALDPAHPEAILVLGMLEIRTGRYDLAIQHLGRVVELAPGFATAQYQLALAHRRNGNAEKAREHQEIYNRLIQEQKAKTIGVRGSKE
jgi:tetratricopeptide (TPR) repeat protein